MSENKTKKSSTKNAGGSKAKSTSAVVQSNMTQRAKMPKVLRIGIIQSGKIIEERIVRVRQNINIGPSEKNDFVLPQEDVSTSRLCLFETKGGNTPYFLNFSKEMKGRISIKGEVIDLSDAATSNTAKKKGKVTQIILSEESRGKIVLGNTTVLFQFVDPPLVQPKPQLPAAVKGNLFQGVELVITICLLISFSFHLGLILHFQLTDWPERSLEQKFIDLQQLLKADTATFENDKKKLEDDTLEGEGDDELTEEGDDDKEPDTPSKAKADTSSEPQAPAKSAEELAKERAEQRAALAEQIAQQGLNKILGSIGGSGAGAIVDVLGGGDVASDQDSLLAQVQGVGAGTGDSSVLKGPAGGAGGTEAADVGQIKTGGGDKTVKTAGPGAEKSISGNVKRRQPAASGGTGMLDADEVARIVGSRLAAIKGCYETSLKRNPSLKGRIDIRFTIAASGNVSSARATTNQLDNSVADCISNVFTRFRFPPPEGGAVTFEYPFMFTPAN
jgi:outer membrane biosynthesis protein TonB